MLQVKPLPSQVFMDWVMLCSSHSTEVLEGYLSIKIYEEEQIIRLPRDGEVAISVFLSSRKLYDLTVII